MEFLSSIRDIFFSIQIQFLKQIFQYSNKYDDSDQNTAVEFHAIFFPVLVFLGDRMSSIEFNRFIVPLSSHKALHSRLGFHRISATKLATIRKLLHADT